MSDSIVVKYTASLHCPTLPVHGVYGGILPNGHFMVSLFVDRPGEPDYVEFSADGGSSSPQPSPFT